jgi:hypothetical protein
MIPAKSVLARLARQPADEPAVRAQTSFFQDTARCWAVKEGECFVCKPKLIYRLPPGA